MANLLGDLWQNGEPDFASALKNPAVKLHLYGKQEARIGRKMGHLTALAETRKEAVEIVAQARRQFTENLKNKQQAEFFK
jgi:5-(carboxyamino)imidazole ribonucleotide synthase